ncbi:hypothetical protein [Deinococcus radiotolerans]|uniref:IPT/TIG domain-containing protein n=1 Tax=Deinococcus radiotolerans TaxID=1309407 RepID=A0ABQ2FQ70_9DEIO|nr:hypothetical protein [Deinococcus radiotolerans]GGL16092.1 hypothetical protein GCM10010844_38700 [Deinococcus radiotolerans]
MRLALLAALVLTACTPTLTGPADPGGARLTVTRGEAFDTVRFDTGTQAVLGAKLTLTGRNLAVNDPNCAVDGSQIVCTLGARPAERGYVLPVRGLLIVQANFARPDGRSYDLITER